MKRATACTSGQTAARRPECLCPRRAYASPSGAAGHVPGNLCGSAMAARMPDATVHAHRSPTARLGRVIRRSPRNREGWDRYPLPGGALELALMKLLRGACRNSWGSIRTASPTSMFMLTVGQDGTPPMRKPLRWCGLECRGLPYENYETPLRRKRTRKDPL